MAVTNITSKPLLPPGKYAELLAIMEKKRGGASKSVQERRRAARLRYRVSNLPLVIEHPGGGTRETTAATYDISAGGIALFTTFFVHTGTKISVKLTSTAGNLDTVVGQIVWCGHVSGAFHLCRIKFHERIDPRQYIAADDVMGLILSDAGKSRADDTGTVLVIDDSEMDRTLVRHHLRETKMKLLTAADEAEALEHVKSGEPISLVLCDLNLDGVMGEDVMRSLRAAGYQGPIAAVTAETENERLESAKRAGATTVIQKPYEPKRFISFLVEWMRASPSGSKIVSELPGDADSIALVESYILSVSTTVEKLRSAVQADNMAEVRTHVQTLRGTGKGFGFPVLTMVAGEAVTALHETQSVGKSMDQINRVEATCRRLAPPIARV